MRSIPLLCQGGESNPDSDLFTPSLTARFLFATSSKRRGSFQRQESNDSCGYSPGLPELFFGEAIPKKLNRTQAGRAGSGEGVCRRRSGLEPTQTSPERRRE